MRALPAQCAQVNINEGIIILKIQSYLKLFCHFVIFLYFCCCLITFVGNTFECDLISISSHMSENRRLSFER